MPYIQLSHTNLKAIAEKAKHYSLVPDSDKYIDLFYDMLRNNIDSAVGMLIFVNKESQTTIFQYAMSTLKIPDSFETDQCLIELAKFYNVVKNEFTENDLFRLGWDKAKLEDLIQGVISKVLIDDDNFHKLISATPDRVLLKSYIGQLPVKYKEMEATRWFSNADRDITLEFISFVNFKTDEVTILRALLLFVGTYIEGQYLLFYPDGGMFNAGSGLYKDCKKFLNVDDFSRLTYPYQSDFFKKLLDFVNHATRSDEFYLFKQKLDKYIRGFDSPQPSYSVLFTKATNVLFTSVGMSNLFATQKKSYITFTIFIHPKNDPLFIDWVNTLLLMDVDKVSEKDKQSIRIVLGIEPKKLMILQPNELTAEPVHVSPERECKM